MPIPLIGILLLMLLHIGFQHETELLEDSLALPGFPPFSCKFGSSEEEYVDSDDLANSRPRTRPSAIQNPPLTDSNLVTVPSGSMKQEFRRRHVPHGWLHKMDPLEPILLFTKPLVPEKLAAAGIVPPTDSSTRNNVSSPPCKFRGRIGRGGRIIFDRWNPLLQTPIDCELQEQGTHLDDITVDLVEFGAELDEVGIVAVDEVNELVVKSTSMGLELGSKRVEVEEASKLRDVGFEVEFGERKREGLNHSRWEFNRSWWCWLPNVIHHFFFPVSLFLGLDGRW
uniref:Uncharacterized protein n=1 Tax=Fagus sylvatica TaxID=28930 RepID=A0A2N9IY54_FAGSY